MATIDDMVPTAEEIADTEKYRKSFGDAWAEMAHRASRVRAYVKKYLDRKEISRGRPFNCYHEGVDHYRRKDSEPLTQEDLTAIFESSPGQGSKVKPSYDGLFVEHSWFVDSSD